MSLYYYHKSRNELRSAVSLVAPILFILLMAQRTNKNLPLTAPPIQSNVQNTPVRPQKEWSCPICGAIFDQEQTKDSHMTGCKRNSYHHQQYSNYVVIDSPKS